MNNFNIFRREKINLRHQSEINPSTDEAFEFMNEATAQEFTRLIKSLTHEDIARVLIDKMRHLEIRGNCAEEDGARYMVACLADASEYGIE